MHLHADICMLNLVMCVCAVFQIVCICCCCLHGYVYVDVVMCCDLIYSFIVLHGRSSKMGQCNIVDM